MSSEYSAVLVRFGEIGIKSDQTRKRMIRQLIQHLQAALNENGVSFSKVRSEYGRIFIESDDAPGAAQMASRVFGVVSTSPVVTVPASIDSILEQGTSLAKLKFEKEKSFAVGSRRVGKHDFSSQEIREKLGASILENMAELDLKVDLKSPDQSIYVEIRDDKAHIFTETVKGVGGMPTGSQGKVVCTISSGLDSPVAAYKVMKRGCIPVFVHFDNSPYSDETNVELAIKQARHLAQFIYNFEVKMYVVPHGDDLTDVLTHAPRKMTCIFCRRNMYRLAREIALMEDADAIVTGEIIGEQASQTTRNLLAETGAICDIPIFRPCIGDDKVEIEHLGQKIGTYKFAHESVSCCSLPPKHPTVYAQLDKIPEAEAKMDFEVLKNEIAEAEIIILKGGK
ncbi:MAG: tRNA uracil 4-sulfurtransferase ThiI [Candidatus Thorarchaeota archaeon]|jgi:thiamine biosynthesis protein ThiI